MSFKLKTKDFSVRSIWTLACCNRLVTFPQVSLREHLHSSIAKLLLFSGFFLAGQASIPAQTLDDHNAHAWFMYFGDHPVSDRWGIHLEAQARRSNIAGTWQQFMFRPGVNYQLNSHVMLTAGYAYVRSHPYGSFPANARFPEHRIFQQVLVKHAWKRTSFQHRFRQEQRFVGQVPRPNAEVDDWQYRNRFRYMVRNDIPLPFRTGAERRFGIALYDEIFLNFGANRGPRVLDQNRAYIALTYKATKNNRVEFGYLHQYIPQRNGRIYEHNHTLQFAWYSVTPFRKQE